MDPNLEDEQLIAEFLDANERAFSQLYERHAARVFDLLTRLIGPVPEREDLLQQVFINVHRALPAFRGEARFTTLLYRIATRAAYDHLRRRYRRPTRIGDEQIDALVDGDASPAQRVRDRQELRRAFELLATLEARKRIAFVLVAVKGMSLREAAKIVGAREATVKQRVLRARRELRAKIERLERRDRRER